MMLSHIKKRLQAAHPNQLYTTKENKLYIFLYQLKENDKIPEVMKVLKEYPIVNGCSEIFSDLSSREKYIQQAELALEYGLVNQQAPSIYSYTEQFGEILLHNLDATIIPSNLYLPAVLQLADYDKTCESNTLETLATFLFKRNDITKTAKALHVHRNTLTYRLQKINKLTGLDINDEKTAWYLQLSLASYYRERITSFF